MGSSMAPMGLKVHISFLGMVHCDGMFWASSPDRLTSPGLDICIY